MNERLSIAKVKFLVRSILPTVFIDYNEILTILVILSKEGCKRTWPLDHMFKNIQISHSSPIIFDLTDIHSRYLVIININMDFHKNVVHSNTSQSQNNKSVEGIRKQ